MSPVSSSRGWRVAAQVGALVVLTACGGSGPVASSNAPGAPPTAATNTAFAGP